MPRWVVAAIVAFAVTRGYIVFGFEPNSFDTALYYRYASTIETGVVPYTTAFPVEYPPLALWTLHAPYVIGEGRPTLAQYRRAFRLAMAACDAAAFALVLAIARRRRPTAVVAAGLIYAGAGALLPHVLYDRLDAALAFLLLAALYAWLRSADGARGWVAVAYGALGLGIAFKLIPVVVVPVLLACETRRRLPFALGALGIATIAPFAIQLAVSGPGVLELFRHHAARGIQVESLYSSIASLAALFGVSSTVAPSFGSYNVDGTFASVLRALSSVALVATVATIAYTAARRRTVLDGYRLACLAVVASLAVSKVMSPQYFVWALPIVALFALEVASPRELAIVAGVVGAIAWLTTWIFPYHYAHVLPARSGDPLPATFAHLAIAVRNLLYLGLVIWLARKELSRTRCVEPEDQ